MKSMILSPNCRTANFENIFDGFFRTPSGHSHDDRFVPRVNISEDEHNVRLIFEVPGLEKGDIKVVVQDSVLTVSGDRKFEREEVKENYVRSEIRSGSFKRSFTLSDSVSHENISADYKNGLLEISLPKKEETKPQKIEVNVS